MTERKNYPELNEDVVKKVQTMMRHRPQWFNMGEWGTVNRTDYAYNHKGEVISSLIKLPGKTNLLEDHREPNYCETAMCLSGTTCLITGRAQWMTDDSGEWKVVKPGKTRAFNIRLSIDGDPHEDNWTDAGAEELGVDYYTARTLFYTCNWPDWCKVEAYWEDPLGQADSAVLLLQALLDDQDIHEPDVAWLIKHKARVYA